MSKSRKQILQELLDLENKNLEEVEETDNLTNIDIVSMNKNDCITDKEDDKITKPKKPRTQKQLEAFDNAKKIRDANAFKRKEERAKKEEEERKLLEEKLVKKAISIKKKEIKKQAVLDEISDDETPIERIKEIVNKPVVIVGPKIRFF